MNKTVREAPKIGPCAEHSRLPQDRSLAQVVDSRAQGFPVTVCRNP
jgi:hypothetical protein